MPSSSCTICVPMSGLAATDVPVHAVYCAALPGQVQRFPTCFLPCRNRSTHARTHTLSVAVAGPSPLAGIGDKGLHWSRKLENKHSIIKTKKTLIANQNPCASQTLAKPNISQPVMGVSLLAMVMRHGAPHAKVRMGMESTFLDTRA